MSRVEFETRIVECWNNGIGLVTGALQQVRFQSAIIPVFQSSKLSMFVVSGVGFQPEERETGAIDCWIPR